jgi:hypothetical protein
MKRINNLTRRRELAENSGESLIEGMINLDGWRIPPAAYSSIIDGSHRLFAVQKKRQATKFVARLDNPRQTNVSDMRSS